ncbi:hypothetical protein IAS59_005094 [Cryptococcus gattii]
MGIDLLGISLAFQPEPTDLANSKAPTPFSTAVSTNLGTPNQPSKEPKSGKAKQSTMLIAAFKKKAMRDLEEQRILQQEEGSIIVFWKEAPNTDTEKNEELDEEG